MGDFMGLYWDYIGIMWGCMGIYWGDYGGVNIQNDDDLTSKNVGKASIHTRFSIAMFDCQRKPQICSFSLRTILNKVVPPKL